MRSRFAPDRELTVRMVAVVFLLGLVYVAFIATLIALLKSVALVVVIVAAMLAAQYWFSDRIALFAMRAHEVTPPSSPTCTGRSTGCARWPTCPSPRWRSPRWICRTRSRPDATPTTPCCA